MKEPHRETGGVPVVFSLGARTMATNEPGTWDGQGCPAQPEDVDAVVALRVT